MIDSVSLGYQVGLYNNGMMLYSAQEKGLVTLILKSGNVKEVKSVQDLKRVENFEELPAGFSVNHEKRTVELIEVIDLT